MSRTTFFVSMTLVLSLTVNTRAAVTLDLIETGDDPIAEMTAAFVAGSGLSVVGGSEAFAGRVGNGDLAQSATYTNFNLVPNVGGLPTISQADGILLTSGVANAPTPNTDPSFDHNSVAVPNPGTGSDPDLSAILVAAGAPSAETNDKNFFSFDFTVPAGITSVEMDFVFASDEFPDQGVTDVFGVFVDGTNYAFFQDGSLVSFVTGVNSDNFNDNDYNTDNYDNQYDGISNSLHLSGILDESLTTHTLKLAIADTSDTIFDSAAFVTNLEGGTNTGGGGIEPIVPEPVSLLVWGGLAIAGTLATYRRRF